MKKPTAEQIIFAILMFFLSFALLSFLFSIPQTIEQGLKGYLSKLTFQIWAKLIISLCLSSLVLLYNDNRLDNFANVSVGNTQHGSARFMTEKEERKSYDFIPDGKEMTPAFIVGRKSKTWITEQTDKTLCLIAPPGGGKTKSVFIPTFYYNAFVNKNTCGKGASILSLDVKSENFKTAGKVLKDNGYDILFLDFRNPLKSYKFNLLNGVNDEFDKYKRTEDKSERLKYYAKAERYAKQVSASIIKNIMGASKDSASDFFDKTAQGLITGLILLVSQYGEPQERHIISVFKLIVELNGLIDNGNIENGQQTSKLMELLKYIDDKRVSDYVGAAINADVRTAMNIFSSALAKLIEFIDAELEQMVCGHSPEINAQSFIDKPTAIFLICPDEDNSRHFFASLFIRYFTTQLIDLAEQTEGMKLKRPVLCFWDEFGNMPPIKDVDGLFTAARSRGIRFLYSLQSFSQLEKNYNRTYKDIILDSSQILMFTFLSPTALETAKKLSEILGNRTVLTGSITANPKKDLLSESTSTSYQMMKRPLMTPDEILSIPIGTYIVLKAGGKTEQIKMKTQLPLYSDYLTKYPEYKEEIKAEYTDIAFLDSNKIRLLEKRKKFALTMGMFD
ncbi:MAG: type IV secretory system conjugative DNA transfer family protein [Candidatus Fimenecus sp.]